MPISKSNLGGEVELHCMSNFSEVLLTIKRNTSHVGYHTSYLLFQLPVAHFVQGRQK